MKKIITVLLVLISLFSLSSCQIEDTNGSDNYELTTITDYDIINNVDVTNSVGTVRFSFFKTVKLSIKKFSGVSVVDSYKLKDRTLNLTVDTKVISGNVRFVVIVNGKIVKDFDVNKENQKYTIESVDGTVLIKVAGESANFKIVIKYDYE